MEAQRRLHGAETDLDARLARRLGAVVPEELAVADVVLVTEGRRE